MRGWLRRWWAVPVAGFVAACGSPSTPLAPGPESPPALLSLKVLGCDSGLQAEFAQVLNPKSVGSTTFFVENAPGVTSYDPAGRAIFFRPTEPFVSARIYVAVLGASLATTAGTRLGEPIEWDFACIDTTPPVVVSHQPMGDGIPTLAKATVQFSEPMDEASITPESVSLAGVEATVSYDPSQYLVTLTPKKPLYPGRTYVGTVLASVRDRAGNALGTDVIWSFQTRAPGADWAVVPVSPPVPAYAPCDSPVALRLASGFDVDPASLTASPIAIDGVPDLTVSWNAAARLIEITPGDPLLPGKSYAVYSTGALQDTLGDKPFDDGAQLFTIQVVPACDTPTVATVPDFEGTIACDAATTVRFSVPMDEASTIAALSFADLTAGGYDPSRAKPVQSTATMSADGLAATLAPVAALTDGHHYLLAVGTGAESLDGQPLAAAGQFEMVAHCP